MRRQQKINRAALFVHRAIEVGPFPFDFHVGLIKPPAPPHGALPAAELLVKLRRILDDPSIEGGMIDRHPSLTHHLLELAIGNWIRYVPPHPPQNDVPLKLTAFEVDHTAAPPPCDHW